MEKEGTQAKYTISVAAALTGANPQTLRDYEKKGLLDPHRTPGNTRLYSDEDLRTVRRIQALVGGGVNLAGVELVVQLQDDLEALQTRYDQLQDEVRSSRRRNRKRG